MEIIDTVSLNQSYEVVLESLKRLERPQLKLSPESLSFLVSHWQELNSKNSPESDYLPLLCILDHAKSGSLDFCAPIAWTLTNRHEKDLIVYSLSAAHKVILEECERQGKRVPFDFIKALKVPLNSSEAEVVEWSLRTIEALGHQSIILKEDVVKSRPGITALFNEHKKNSKELVDYLIKRWEGRL